MTKRTTARLEHPVKELLYDHLDLKGDAFDNFADSIKTADTKTTYVHRLQQYMLHKNVTSIKELVNREPQAIEKDVIGYLKFLKNDRKVAYATRYVIMSMLKKLYAMNDVVLNWDKIRGFLGTRERTIEDRAYSKDEIAKLLSVAPLRTRVLILVLSSSGLRRGAVPGIKRKHMTWIEKYQLYKFIIYPKANERYVTFCTPECAKEINSYFQFRRQCGEELTNESPLIREDFDTSNPEKARLAKPATNVSLKFIMMKATKAAGLRLKHGVNEETGKPLQRTELMLTHALRKFYDGNLVRAVIHPIRVAALMGHKQGLQSSYYRPSDEELLEAYIIASELLTISSENVLKREVDRLKAETADIDTMKKSYLDMKLELERQEQGMEKRIEQAVQKHIQDLLGRVDLGKLRES